MGCELTTAEVEHIDRTIADLRAENERLREQIYWLKQGDILHVLTDQEYIDQCERERLMQVSIDALDKENAKLRELVREACEMARTFYNLGGTYNDLDDLLCEANELGVEV